MTYLNLSPQSFIVLFTGCKLIDEYRFLFCKSLLFSLTGVLILKHPSQCSISCLKLIQPLQHMKCTIGNFDRLLSQNALFWDSQANLVNDSISVWIWQNISENLCTKLHRGMLLTSWIVLCIRQINKLVLTFSTRCILGLFHQQEVQIRYCTDAETCTEITSLFHSNYYAFNFVNHFMEWALNVK